MKKGKPKESVKMKKKKSKKSIIELDRKDFRGVLNNLRPALAADDYIQALTCFCFNGDMIYAFDNVMAIALPLVTGFQGGVSGDLFFRIISSLSTKDLELEYKDKELAIKAGKSFFTAPMLPIENLVMDAKGLDRDKKANSLQVSEQLLSALEKCSISVSDDPIHPAHMGITIVGDGKNVTAYSTDNHSISKYTYSDKVKFPSVVLPIAFCKQLLAMKSILEGGILDLSKDFVGVRNDMFSGNKYVLFSKYLHDGGVTDFEPVIDKYLGNKKQVYFPIPGSLEQALERALILVGNETAKKTVATLSTNSISLLTETNMGRNKDKILVKGKLMEGTFSLSADRVLRGCKENEEAAFGEKVMLFKSKNFLHVVAYLAKV